VVLVPLLLLMRLQLLLMLLLVLLLLLVLRYMLPFGPWSDFPELRHCQANAHAARRLGNTRIEAGQPLQIAQIR
jgi:hypothetical protein